jgi:hypothetical protein
MTYTITRSDGVTDITVEDGSINSTPALSIGLVGKNTQGYGEQIATNFVHLMEHFANSTEPSDPVVGQQWYDTGNTVMKVYNGTAWESMLSGAADGDFVIGGHLLPAEDCGTNPPYSDIGSSSLKFCNVYANTFHGNLNGIATQARYADLAERYHADDHYLPGTLVKLGGENEVTITADEADPDVFGVVSEMPGTLLNAEAGPDETHPKIGMVGRIYVGVEGDVKRGERLVSSSVPGKAKAVADLNAVSPFAVFGRALEDSKDGKVLAVVGVK